MVEQGQQKWEWFVAQHWMPMQGSVIALFINPEDPTASSSTHEEVEEIIIAQPKEDVEDLIQPSMKKMDDNRPPTPIVESPMTQQTVYTVAEQDTISDEKATENVPEPSKISEQ